MASLRNPPKEVWFVTTVPTEAERKRYYGTPRPSRIYPQKSGAVQFIQANPNRDFKVYKATVVEWEEIDAENISNK